MADEFTNSIKRIAESPVFLEDAQTLGSIPNESFQAAISSLQSAQEIPESIFPLLNATLADEKGSKALVNFLVNFARLRSASNLSPNDFQTKYGNTIIESITERLPGVADSFNTRLPDLVAEYPVLQLYLRIDELKEEAATSLEKFRVLCDIRPIFSDDGSTIDAFVSHTMLHIQYDVTGTSQGLDIQISEAQVEDMLRQLTRAKKKLSSLKEFIQEIKPTLQSATSTKTINSAAS